MAPIVVSPYDAELFGHWWFEGPDFLGTSSVQLHFDQNERGIRAERLGDSVGEELVSDLAAGATVDLHASDPLLVYFALAQGGSYLVRSITSHAGTAMRVLERFLPVQFELAPKGDLIRLNLVPS